MNSVHIEVLSQLHTPAALPLGNSLPFHNHTQWIIVQALDKVPRRWYRKQVSVPVGNKFHLPSQLPFTLLIKLSPFINFS